MSRMVFQIGVLLIPVLLIFCFNMNESLAEIVSKFVVEVRRIMRGSPIHDLVIQSTSASTSSTLMSSTEKFEDINNTLSEGNDKIKDPINLEENKPNPYDTSRLENIYSSATFEKNPEVMTLTPEKLKRLRCKNDEWINGLINKRLNDEYNLLHKEIKKCKSS